MRWRCTTSTAHSCDILYSIPAHLVIAAVNPSASIRVHPSLHS
jgi:hypothetical protein